MFVCMCLVGGGGGGGGGGGYTLMTGFVTTIFHVTADGYVVLLSNYF